MKVVFQPTDFKEVREYFRARVPMHPGDFALLEDDAKLLAFTVSQIASMDMIAAIQNEIDRAIEDGKTVPQFREEFQDFLERKGFEGMEPYRADTIFRTNLQTQYHVGRYAQMTDPDVIQERPWWMYSAVHDSATRPEHLGHDGEVHRADDPFWDMWYPPNGYNCRCDVITLDDDDLAMMKEKGVARETSTAPIDLPDPGFRQNPGKAVWEPDLSKYPSALVAEYMKRMSENI